MNNDYYCVLFISIIDDTNKTKLKKHSNDFSYIIPINYIYLFIMQF